MTGDVARALGRVHKKIGKHGGVPTRLLVMGHSSGGQLAALMCTTIATRRRRAFH
jgi:acetyl esterase/lipase